MKTKLHIRSVLGILLFEHEAEDNSILKTLKEALKRGVDLTGSDLTGVDLTGVDFRGAKNKELAYMPQFCKWTHSIKGNKIQLGCKEKTVEEWQLFFESNEEYSTKRGTKEFKQIQAIFESYKAYLNHLAS